LIQIVLKISKIDFFLLNLVLFSQNDLQLFYKFPAESHTRDKILKKIKQKRFVHVTIYSKKKATQEKSLQRIRDHKGQTGHS
jgi:hypothetical protein